MGCILFIYNHLGLHELCVGKYQMYNRSWSLCHVHCSSCWVSVICAQILLNLLRKKKCRETQRNWILQWKKTRKSILFNYDAALFSFNQHHPQCMKHTHTHMLCVSVQKTKQKRNSQKKSKWNVYGKIAESAGSCISNMALQSNLFVFVYVCVWFENGAFCYAMFSWGRDFSRSNSSNSSRKK